MTFLIPSNSSAFSIRGFFLLFFLAFTSFSFSQNSQELCVGSTIGISNPDPAGSWISSDPSIATVDNMGNVSGISSGYCTIQIMDNLFNVSGTSIVQVITTTSALFGRDSVCVDGVIHLTSSTSSGSWVSSNPTIASVNGNGEITGHVVGSTTITYTVCNYSVSKNISVYLANPPTLTLLTAPGTLHQTLNPDHVNATSDTAFYAPMDTVRFQIGGGATSAYLASGPNSLPKGVTGTFSNGIFTICGTPYLVAPFTTTNSTFSYTVSTLGGTFCVNDPYFSNGDTLWTADTLFDGYTGDITLTPPCFNTINGASIVVCYDHPYTLMFSVTGSPTGVNATSLPPGCSGSYANGMYTLNGFASVEGIFPIVLHTTGGTCFQGQCSNTLMVEPPLFTAGPIVGPSQICVGTTAVLSLANYANYTFEYWSSQNPNIALVGGNGTVTGMSAGTTTITYTYGNGSCTNTEYFTITVNSLPNVSAGINQTACQGTGVTLSGSGANTYSWTNGITDNVNFFSPLGDITYVVTGTDINGCTNTDQVIVTVNPLPNVSAGADQTICVGSTITLSGQGAYTYIWDNGITNNSSFIPSIGTHTYTVEGTDINGCTNTDQVIVTVNPAQAITPITGPTSVCLDASITLSNTTAGGTWSSQNSSIATIDQNGIVTGQTSGLVTITYSLNNNCTLAQTYQIQVEQAPVIEPIFGESTICTNSAITLSTTTQGGVWSSLNEAIAVVSPFGIVTGISEGTCPIVYTLTTGNCTATTIEMMSIVSCTNLALSSPALSDQQHICLTNPIIPIEYSMTGNAANVLITNGNLPTGISGNYSNGVFTISGIPTELGTFPYTISTSGSTFGSEISLTGSITIETIPTVSFSYTVNDLTVQFTNTSVNASSSNYSWDFGNNYSVENNPTYTFPAPGTYAVVLSIENSCGTNSTIETIGILNINEITIDEIAVFPNPVENFLHIEMKFSEGLEIVIQDLAGKIVHQEYLDHQEGINVSDLEPGSYVLVVTSKNGSSVKRFTKTE